MAIIRKTAGIVLLLTAWLPVVQIFAQPDATESTAEEEITFRITLDGRHANLLWQMNTAAFSYISGFNVERRAAFEQAWTDLGFVNEGLCRDAVCSWQFTDRNLPAGTDEVYYRVKVFQLGVEPWYSNDVLLGISSVQPDETILYQNYPNPVNAASPVTTIRYRTAGAGYVTLSVFNAAGQLVRTIVDEVQPNGTHTAQFNTASLPQGLYYYRLDTPKAQIVKKMPVVR